MSKSKTELVREALTQNPNPNPEQVGEIAKACGCSKALVYKVLGKMPKPTEGVTPIPVEPVVRVAEQEAEEVPAMEEVEEKAPPEFEKKAVPVETLAERVEVEEEIRVMKDMLRGLYVLLVSDEGVLGVKYGRPKDQCVQVSDQTYRWLTRRVTPEQLESYDTVLLALSHVALVAPVITAYWKERKTKTKKEEVKT